jgi:hypothetical protein
VCHNGGELIGFKWLLFVYRYHNGVSIIFTIIVKPVLTSQII